MMKFTTPPPPENLSGGREQMMFSIANKITVLFISLIIVLSITIGFYSLERGKQFLTLSFNDKAMALVNSLAAISESPVLFHDTEMLSGIGAGALSQKDVVSCTITDRDGVILFQKKRVDEKNVKKYTAAIRTEKMGGNEEGLMLGKGEKEFEEIGKITLIFSFNNIKNSLEAIRQIILLGVMLGIVLGSIAIALLIRVVLGRPIDRLVANTRIIASGNLDHLIPVSKNDEIGFLTESFNHMTQELKASQERLIKAEKMSAMSQIASEAAHEIRNPLQIISTGVYLLKQITHEENPLVFKTIKQMDAAVLRASDFINDLLHFSRPISLKMESVNINEIIKAAIAELPEGILSGIEVNQGLSDNIPQVSADFARLKQVVINLVKNAAEAIEQLPGRIEIQSESTGDFVRISVSDTGKGIPKESLLHLFDPFHTTKKKGIGLGLSICKRFVEAHDGSRIEVESEPGKGTRFIVWLGVRRDARPCVSTIANGG